MAPREVAGSHELPGPERQVLHHSNRRVSEMLSVIQEIHKLGLTSPREALHLSVGGHWDY